MPYHILRSQHTDADLIDPFQYPQSIVQAGARPLRQILLRHITGDDRLGAKTDTGQEHLHLRRCGILRLIQNHKGVVQRAAAHVGKRRHLNESLLHVFLEGLRSHDLIESVIERTQIRINLALQISRQKAQLLPGFNGRTGQYDPVHLVGLKGCDCFRHGKIGLAGTGGTHAENDHLVVNGLHIFLLSHGLWLHRLAHDRMTDDIAVQLRHGLHRGRLGHGQRKSVIDILFRDHIAPLGQDDQLVNDLLRLPASFLAADDLYLIFPENDGHMERPLHLFQIGVKLSENIARMCRRKRKFHF